MGPLTLVHRYTSLQLGALGKHEAFNIFSITSRMSLLDKIRDRFSGDGQPKNFEVTFNEVKLGMTLSAGSGGEAVVQAVTNGGAAAKAHVRPSDIVNSINGNPCPQYESLIEIIQGVGRPVVLGFFRPGTDTGGGSRRGAMGARLGVATSQGVQNTAAKQKPMTEEEKAERRQAALKAAESRTNDWNKRLNKGRQATQTKSATNGMTDNKFEDSTNAETRRIVQLTKEQERRTAANMGYNPYEARMMGNNVARAAIGGAETGGGIAIPKDPPHVSQERGPLPPVGGRDRWAKDDFRNEDASLVETFRTEIEEALDTVLEQGHGTSLTAVETMLKIMKKMAENPSEDKFKRIRLGNAGFHSKVGGVDGGLEVMNAAGFEIDTSGEEPVLRHGSCDPVPLRLRVAIQVLSKAEAKLKGGSV